jgi:signal transduction histidine kinase/HAMP domain-containing protein
MNYFKKDSLRKSLVLSLIVLSIAPLLLVGIILSWQDVRVLKLQAKDSQKKLTMLVANKMSSFIHEFEASLLTAVRTHDLMEMKHDQQSLVLSKMLFSSMDLEHRDVFKGLTLLNSEGKELVRVSRERLFTDAQLADRSSIDEFTIPAANKKIYYSTVFFNEQTGEPYLEVSIPIIDFQSNQLRGVLVAELSMKNLWDAIADVRVGTTGITYVLSDKGRVIAHPNPSVVLKGTYFKLPKANGVVTGLQGKKSYMVIDTLMFGNQSLKIVTELPVSEALHYAFLALYIIVGFLIISLMGAVSLGYILVRQIVQPIESLSGTAQLISKGDFSQRMHVSRTDEIGALADAFNTMTSQLIDTINSLKKEIDERKQIENQVLQQNELLNNILNSLSHPFYVIDTSDYTIKLANEAAHFGELAGDPKCYMLTHKNDEPCSGDEHPCTIREINRTKKPVILEHIHYDSEGHALFFDVHGYPIFDSNGNIVQVIEYTVDVTARKKLEHQFLQAQKMEAVGQLAGGIAHDFNNLLSAILGYAEMALMDLPDDHPARAKLRTIMDAGEKATVLTRQLLTFSRKQIMDMKVVSLNSIIESMAKILYRLIGEDISLELNTRADVRNVKADASQMEQVLMNLVVNARDAMPNGGRLTIETENVELDEEYARGHEGIKPGSYVMFAVTDTGIGMSREVQDRIFEPFFTTKGSRGTGLGLSTIYGIIKQHGGNIFLYSEPNVGTTFKIYLPATGEAPEKKVTEERDIMIHGTETILVVEDEPSILRLIADSLQPLGYEILEASCGREALQILNARGGEIDLLLTDVIMPEMSGTELAAIVRTIRPSMKIVFMSGYTDEMIFHDFTMDSDMSFLQKPLTPRKLVSKLNEALHKKVA